MDKCNKCGLELYAAPKKQAQTTVINGNTKDKKTQLVLRQYLTCRNPQCPEFEKVVLNIVDLKFDEE